MLLVEILKKYHRIANGKGMFMFFDCLQPRSAYTQTTTITDLFSIFRS